MAEVEVDKVLRFWVDASASRQDAAPRLPSRFSCETRRRAGSARPPARTTDMRCPRTVSHETAKVAADYAMPGWALALVKLEKPSR